MAKAKKKSDTKPTKKCEACNGTGSICNACGEDSGDCQCERIVDEKSDDPDADEQDLQDCVVCGGLGKVPA